MATPARSGGDEVRYEEGRRGRRPYLTNSLWFRASTGRYPGASPKFARFLRSIYRLEPPKPAKKAADDIQDHHPGRHIPNPVSAWTDDVAYAPCDIMQDASGPNGHSPSRAIFASDASMTHDHALRANRALAATAGHSRRLLLVLMAVVKIRIIRRHLNRGRDWHEFCAALRTELRRFGNFRSAFHTSCHEKYFTGCAQFLMNF
jgi:hypothetical protein